MTEISTGAEPPTADDLALADRLLATTGLIRRRARRAVGAPFDARLSQAQAEVVRHVRHHPGVSVKETADALGLAPNTVSTLIASLVDAGMLRRESDPADMRVARLTLTDSAREPLEAWRAQRQDAVGAAVAGLTAQQRADLDRGLTVLQLVAEHLAGEPLDE